MIDNKLIESILSYIKKDYTTYPLRFCVEVIAWVSSIISSIIFAATVPNIPVIPLYVIFLTGCFAACWASWTRGSFGLVLNYIFIIVIDLIGLGRVMLK
jgi:hypothetical protein